MFSFYVNVKMWVDSTAVFIPECAFLRGYVKKTRLKMFTEYYQSGVIITTIIVFYAIDFSLLAHYDKKRQVKGSGRNWSYTMMVIIAASFMIVQPILLPGLGLHIDGWLGGGIQMTGLVLLLSGLTIHGWARIHLQQFYTERIELQPDHYVVVKGPYAYIRHPVFTSFFISVSGLFLVNPSLPMLLMAIYTFWDFSQAAKREEMLLRQNVAGYAEYMARTSRFFPRISVLSCNE